MAKYCCAWLSLARTVKRTDRSELHHFGAVWQLVDISEPVSLLQSRDGSYLKGWDEVRMGKYSRNACSGCGPKRCSVNISPFPLPLPFRMGQKRSKNVGELSDALSGECSMGCCGWNRVRVRRGSTAFDEKVFPKAFMWLAVLSKREGPQAPRGLWQTVCYFFSLSPSFSR